MENYKQDPKLSFVIKAIYTLAYGLHNMVLDVCGSFQGICQNLHPFNGSLFKVCISIYRYNITLN